jgi:GR25 family glycosyltransferase involved in LPS biosynthesis
MPIYCINLKHRTDRKEHSLNEFKKIGISEDKVMYLPFTKDARGGVYGCFDSHMKIWISGVGICLWPTGSGEAE